MITPNPNLLCEQAKLYCYDFLSDESRGLIPESVTNHIEQCQHCRGQIDQLKVVLSQTDGIEPEQGQVNSAITTMLELHFAYIGKRVTCKTVSPFLPGLLDPALEIRIPTPITAHLDNCKQCSEDLEAIRELNLKRKQLYRLSQFLAEKPSDDSVSCSQARIATFHIALMAFHETSAADLKHFCTCPNCRKAVYQYRESVRTDLLHYEKAPKEFPCEEVSASDIFDYCLPYGIDPAADQYAKFRESLTSHLHSCPTCLAKIQELHRTIYNIADRAESNVVTIYHIDESAKAKAISESDDLYAGFPISVEIASREDKVDVEQPVPTIDFTTALKRKVSARNLKPLLKTGIVAAAVILVAVALFKAQSAKAVTIERIYNAIEKVKNVYISSFVPDKAEPTQEKWVSRTLNIYMLKTGKELTLWDISKGTRKIWHVDTAVTETTPLTDNSVASVERKISSSLGLMPFYDISEIPPGAEWHRADDEILEVAEGVEIYDLKWIPKEYTGSPKFKKWRVFADAKTGLPQRVEWYTRFADDAEFVLETVMVVEYLDESGMQAVIKEVSF